MVPFQFLTSTIEGDNWLVSCLAASPMEVFVYLYAQLPLIEAVAGYVCNSKFLHLHLFSATHTMNHNLYGTAINVDCCLLTLC